MITKPCPRCRKCLIPVGVAYCKACTTIVNQELEQIRERNKQNKTRQYNNNRSKKYVAFYRSKDWKATSRSKLESTEYKCEAKLEGCRILATEVHHIKPIQTPEGWDKRLDWNNLESVCTACHNSRHPERSQKFKSDNDNFIFDLRSAKKS